MLRIVPGAHFVAGLTTLTAACAHREPPTPEGAPSVALPELASAPVPVPVPASVPVPAPATPIASSEPAPLPQTHDMPRASGPAFETRARALWEAIVTDDPDPAMPFFFPLGAYEQVKDIGAPASDWKHRLVAAYARDIHALHRRLASGGSSARLVSLDVPDGHARWVEPGEEYNKIGYFRVFGSKLRYEDDDGAAKTFDVKSLISWRGEWYVVHLSAIK